MLQQVKELPNDSGRPLLSYNNFTDKNKMAAIKKQCLFLFVCLFVFFFVRFLYCTEFSPTVIQSPRFTNDYKFCISVNKYHSRHSNLNFAHILLFIDCFKMAQKKNQYQESHHDT